MELISVIVPAYNVEKYLARCLDSILAQTYRDFEIIVIDDGSSDRTSGICDEYASADSRIRVVHKENEGVAAARNTALDLAEGKELAFADADDCYEPDMLYKLHEAMAVHNADMAVCGYYEEFPDRVEEHGTGGGISVFDRSGAYKDYFRMDGRIGSGCWNKLIKTAAVRNLRFKKYRMGEDVEWICRVLDNCNIIVCTDHAGYHYIHRETSATRIGFSDANLDILKASDDMLDHIRKNHPELIAHVYAFHAAWYSAQIQVLHWAGNFDGHEDEKAYIRSGLRANMKEYRSDPYIPMTDKIYIYSYMLGLYRPVKKAHDILSALRKKMKGKRGEVC